ncbi:DUF2393 domain-containing protein [Candidatus Sulfurimonas marisnigri]|uniref:DUF2393 domain-containing protein n=1 Tax=Candidatus Sulfurimonas marisnigri TaxID=2740405 RepID=A0A7S7M1A4_9BACT|nr:DUF2393 family protein [Candidatus Sulfurimonas marisnigri]QOY54409.1 DUF2393 domain-containing protein [Candidatus Sulfurimonas marisnigri]
MNSILTTFIDELIIYDYILFGSIFALFILFFIVGLILRKKPVKAIVFISSAFLILLFGSTLGYSKMHEYLFSNTTSIVSQKRLTYTQAVVVYATVKNNSNVDFKNCKISASAYKVTNNAVKDYMFKFKPLKKMSILEYDILKGEDREFKIILEPFTYSNDYNISVEASCR